MSARFPYTQIRIARPTNQIERVTYFYKHGLGLEEIGRFDDHEGFSGVMLGLPDATYHLEFTQHKNARACPPPSKDNLIVFYFPDAAARDVVADRIAAMGHAAVKPENPYWKRHGLTFEDPDRWRVVLMAVPGFSIDATDV